MPWPLRLLRTKSKGASLRTKKSKGAGEGERKEDDAGAAELVATTASDEEDVLRAVCDAFIEGVGGGTVMGRTSADGDKDDADGSGDSDGGKEEAEAGRETVTEVVGCAIGVVTEEVGAGEGTTVRGGAVARTIRGIADFLERVLILFLEALRGAADDSGALRGAADDLALASFAALQQMWHLLRAGRPLVLMN